MKKIKKLIEAFCDSPYIGCKTKNTKKKMALLGLKKDKDGDYRYIDPDDTTSEFVPVRNRNKNKENK